MNTIIIIINKQRWIGSVAALPYFDHSVAVPDMVKKPYFDFDSRTHPPPKKGKLNRMDNY